MPRVLLIGPNPNAERTLKKLLAAEEYFCSTAAGPEQALQALAASAYHLVILDARDCRSGALETLRAPPSGDARSWYLWLG